MGGNAQIFIYRTLSLDWFGGDVYPAMNFFKALIPVFGTLFLIGTGIIVYDLLTMGHRAPSKSAAPAADAHAGPAALQHAPGRWSRYLEGYEAGLWLMGMWIFGAVITFGLLSFNLPSVRAGNPTLPYILAWVGYPGLLLITLLFVWRFLASLEARAKDPANAALPLAVLKPA